MSKTLSKLLAAAITFTSIAAVPSAQAQGAPVYFSGAATPAVLVEEKVVGENLLNLREEADLRIVFDSTPPEEALRIDAFNFNPRSGRFAARFIIDSSQPIVMRGQVEATLNVLLPSRRISAGEVIAASDLKLTAMPAAAMSSNLLRDARDIIGQEAKRTLMPGRPISDQSLIKPRVIHRGDEVLINYADGVLDLTVPGRALEDGALEDTLRIVNLQSSKTIHAQVFAPGVVIVKPTASLIISND